LAVNAIYYAAYGAAQPIPAFEITYQDNGIYYYDVQTIDDDMWWDFSSGYPIFVGPNRDPNNPGADYEDWISHSIHPIEVLNTDPVITPRMRAYAEVDLSLRMSGNKHNTATLRLLESGGVVDEVTVYRDPGSPDVGVFSATIEMTEGYDYSVEVEYDPDDLSGSNPTWIFDTHWPDGKIKELKHTFNSNDPDDRVWTIENFESFMIGHDIIFEAWASDYGSDDLAFVWNFGDTTPFGVHIYANADPDVHVGVSDEATVIFNQDPDRDPWFDKSANSERSADGTAIVVKDTIVHAFDENQPYYYYVTLTVMDDDVKEDYPSTQLHGIPGLDYCHVEIDLT
jgi:hypothetical protein